MYICKLYRYPEITGGCSDSTFEFSRQAISCVIIHDKLPTMFILILWTSDFSFLFRYQYQDSILVCKTCKYKHLNVYVFHQPGSCTPFTVALIRQVHTLTLLGHWHQATRTETRYHTPSYDENTTICLFDWCCQIPETIRNLKRPIGRGFLIEILFRPQRAPY